MCPFCGGKNFTELTQEDVVSLLGSRICNSCGKYVPEGCEVKSKNEVTTIMADVRVTVMRKTDRLKKALLELGFTEAENYVTFGTQDGKFYGNVSVQFSGMPIPVDEVEVEESATPVTAS